VVPPAAHGEVSDGWPDGNRRTRGWCTAVTRSMSMSPLDGSRC
jgi:hypothetical protein